MDPCDTGYMATLAVGNVGGGGRVGLWRGKRYEGLRKLHEARQRRGVSATAPPRLTQAPEPVQALAAIER